ncbi:MULTISPECIES: SRPBCC family protein [unclassified Geodermatophilus]|uniref:SRPBCC family protein n=1 Tax=unclassified Geodermatophilus TaxID=2637632 RepID=UPI003EEB6511
MPELVETVDVDAPPERVWAALTDWTRQGEWMLLTDVETVGDTVAGVGARLAARTGVPWRRGRHLGVLDTMVVTEWDPPRRVVVQHTGRIVRGPGIFVVTPRGEHATLEWTERLYLPFGVLGRLGWPLVRPVMVIGVRRSLRRFAAFAATHPG